MMDVGDNIGVPIVDGRLTAIRFGLATHDEVVLRYAYPEEYASRNCLVQNRNSMETLALHCTSSVSGCSISHPSQLTNPFLGLPLESGKCESCGTAEPGKCDGHFGYIQLPVPVYHPSHVSELKKLLSLICMKCLRMKKLKIRLNGGNEKSANAPCAYCPEIPLISVNEVETSDGAVFLELKLPSKSPIPGGFWNFLNRYGYQYGEEKKRPLLPCEVLEMLERFPEETRKKLAGKGYFSQDGYILQKLPVPPNCLSVPDISDGISIMSSDISISMLKKVLKQVEIIRSSRSGPPNFESHKVEANDLQLAISQYLHVRGTAKANREFNRFGVSKEANNSSTKDWLEKMRTLFISKGSGFSSRTVITGDAYKRVNEVGLPLEIAQMVTFEEKVTEQNKDHLQLLVDKNLCVAYKDKGTKYSLTEGSKGHTLLKVGQVVHRRVMDGDFVFINRQPSTHKHSLQALSVYLHSDHTVKINPLICAPLSADFDGDCIHMFYPQSLAAKAEVLELFSVEQQLLSSHSGDLNFQFANDALLSLKIMLKNFSLDKPTAQQLAMFANTSLPQAALKTRAGSWWTATQILQTALPAKFDCRGERYEINQSEILKIDSDRDMVQLMINEIISTVFFEKGSKEALNVFNSLQPLLMENIFSEGYSVSLKDFCVAKSVLEGIKKNVQDVSPLLHQLRLTYNELVELQAENQLRSAKLPIVDFIRNSDLGCLIDSKSESSIDKVVQQLGFLGLQLADRGKFYTRTLFEDVHSFMLNKYVVNGIDYPSEVFGLIKSCFVEGLNPYEELAHSISSREVLVRSSRGLTEPGTLFKNLMAILRDVVICYDGTVRNLCTNSIVQFEYGVSVQSFCPAGEPVGVLAATAISTPAYKAVLDSSPSSNSSWELMKEILLCGVNFKNDLSDRRVIIYLNNCGCGKKYCKENAAYLVRNQLTKVSLKDIAVSFLIEYQKQQIAPGSSMFNAGLVGHIHLDKKLLKDKNLNMHKVLLKCQETLGSLRGKKKSELGDRLKRFVLSVSECCCFPQSCDVDFSQNPCLRFSSLDTSGESLHITSQLMANVICPLLWETIVKGDRRVYSANIIWINTDATSWVRNHCRTQNGELALEVVLEKGVVKESGDGWRIVLDACLPVIRSVDTTRSIPYAIKQMQELLGISCAFDQAVQKLSKSVRKVAKGVLKEHLTLLANSMTCTGNLIGFTRGGYKALFRSLNVKVPFTEATLFMPRKCFERAAEKCHEDALSSIVASCAWGKEVAVGTGTQFEILWDKKEMGSKQDGVLDIHNFLQLVRTSSNGERSTNACLGEDVDDLDFEDGDMELTFSPDNDPEYGKPIFDDAEVQRNFEQQLEVDKDRSGELKWEIKSSLDKSAEPIGWNSENAVTGLSKSSAWPGWSTEIKESQVSDPKQQSDNDDRWGKPPEVSAGNGWDKKAEEAQWKESQNGPLESWSIQADEPDRTGWSINEVSAQKSHSKESHGWNSKLTPEKVSEPNWGCSSGGEASARKFHNQGQQPRAQFKPSSWDTNTMAPQNESPKSWSKPLEEPDRSGWSKNEGNAQKPQGKESDDWDSRLTQEKVSQPNWGSWSKPSEEPDRSSWSKNEGSARKSQLNETDDSDSKLTREKVSQPNWGSSSGGEVTESTLPHQEEQLIETQFKSPSWDMDRMEPASQPESSHAWDSPAVGNQTQNQWGKQKSGPRGWGSTQGGDWKSKKNRIAKSPGKPDDWNTTGPFTASRQRLDQFTSEEQSILSDVDPILRSIRRILQQSRNCDGDRLSHEDQTYILGNVFNYHPDKAVKMGHGVDYVTVSQHSSFQDSRCFYIVSSDGHREDFSYRKCLENFVKTKYPEMAETFNSKYFRKPGPRTGGVSGGNE